MEAAERAVAGRVELSSIVAPVATQGEPRRREQRSLFGELLDWMLAPLLLLWPMSVVLTWLVAQGIAAQPFDRELGEKARLLAAAVVASRSPAPPAVLDLLQGDAAEPLRFLVSDRLGRPLVGDGRLPLPEDDAISGEPRFRDAKVDGVALRIAYVWTGRSGTADSPGALVQVAETFTKRSQLAGEIIKGVIIPQFVILPVAVFLVWLALARGIAPLNDLQQRIRRRDSSDLSPIDEREAPEEVSPLVRAINDLLGRLERSIGAQKRFLADAAHQLKTPLAGLRTQAELAQQQIDAGQHEPQALKQTLQQIARSSQNAAHMVNQLLSMARAEDKEHASHRQPVDMLQLATEVVRDFVPRAFEKRIDLGLEAPTADARPAGGADAHGASAACLRVDGHAVLLRELIRNLVDNALQYTPAGGTVTVRVHADPFGRLVLLQVEDSGPGIARVEREEVFRPFYRALGTEVDGSGLGLAIVREIARQHGGDVTVEDADPRSHAESRPGVGPGARFTLRLPAR